jgi:hypothetical protein
MALFGERRYADRLLVEKPEGKGTLGRLPRKWKDNACNETNLMHCLSSVYWVNTPLHVSGLLVAHHQEVARYICNN